MASERPRTPGQKKSRSRPNRIVNKGVSGGLFSKGRRQLLEGANQAELRERRNAVIKTDFFSDFAVLHP